MHFSSVEDALINFGKIKGLSIAYSKSFGANKHSRTICSTID